MATPVFASRPVNISKFKLSSAKKTQGEPVQVRQLVQLLGRSWTLLNAHSVISGRDTDSAQQALRLKAGWRPLKTPSRPPAPHLQTAARPLPLAPRRIARPGPGPGQGPRPRPARSGVSPRFQSEAPAGGGGRGSPPLALRPCRLRRPPRRQRLRRPLWNLPASRPAHAPRRGSGVTPSPPGARAASLAYSTGWAEQSSSSDPRPAPRRRCHGDAHPPQQPRDQAEGRGHGPSRRRGALRGGARGPAAVSGPLPLAGRSCRPEGADGRPRAAGRGGGDWQAPRPGGFPPAPDGVWEPAAEASGSPLRPRSWLFQRRLEMTFPSAAASVAVAREKKV